MVRRWMVILQRLIERLGDGWRSKRKFVKRMGGICSVLELYISCFQHLDSSTRVGFKMYVKPCGDPG
jgi:hypothetical protein